ncbi:MAG TPA: OsmC family protein [Streptosporangiaceae bacterium]
MTKATLRSAVLGGVLGGVMMAVWLMFILWLTGIGFWTLLNLITNTFWRAVPLNGKFSVWSLIIGLVAHVIVALIFGALIALAAWVLPVSRTLIIAGGALVGPIIWVVMQYGIWRAVDPAAAQIITPWVFAVAHLIFGVLAAAVAAIITTDEKAAGSTRLIVDEPGPQSTPEAFRARTAGRHASPDTGQAPAERARPYGTEATGQYAVQVTGPQATQVAGPDAAAAASRAPVMTAQDSEAVPHRRLLTARNDGGLRTVVYTSGGPGMVTDEPTANGGTGSALNPLETVLGAACGSIGATFARVARETGVIYDGINFEASYTADPRGQAGQPGVPPYFETVMIQARVRATRPDSRLADVARATERRCPVRNLLADAGVRVELRWSAVAPETPSPELQETPDVARQPDR